jgi:hypothetical protein
MLTLLEAQLMRLVCESAGLGLARHTSSVIAAATGAVAIGDLGVAAGVSSTHLAQRFEEVIGVTPACDCRATADGYNAHGSGRSHNSCKKPGNREHLPP